MEQPYRRILRCHPCGPIRKPKGSNQPTVTDSGSDITQEREKVASQIDTRRPARQRQHRYCRKRSAHVVFHQCGFTTLCGTPLTVMVVLSAMVIVCPVPCVCASGLNEAAEAPVCLIASGL